MIEKLKIRIMVMCRFHNGKPAPFILDQIRALEQENVDIVSIFDTMRSAKSRNGFIGYLKAFVEMIREIKKTRPDVIHAHYGITGLLANMQRRVPVVTTYHGSDINLNKVRLISKLSAKLSAFNIFVSKKNLEQIGEQNNCMLLPCGVDENIFYPVGKKNARKQIGLEANGKYVLFAGAYDVPVKNATLAKESISKLNGIKLLELKGYTREQVAMLLNAVDCLLMTSKTEGSPQVIKEAIAVGCPIVSVDVGDVRERIEGLDNCVITGSNSNEIAEAIKSVISSGERINNGIGKISHDLLDNKMVAKKIIEIYRRVLSW